MAATTQTVIIDFQADFSSVQDAVDILEKTGKVDAELAATFRKTNTEINKQGQALTNTAKQGQQSTQSFTKLSQLMQQFPKTGLNRFLLQVGNELTAAGLKASDFYKKVDPKDTLPKIQSLRQELKTLKDQMQQAALSGGMLGEEYLRLKKRAGELDDTIRDVGNDIRNAGSDTRGIDNVVGSISALAGGFSAVQGAAALFGDESEDLQKALLRVNAAMALATGLQQVSNALTKQGSLARIADATATGFQVVAQKIYDATLKGSIVSLKAFKIALASTGIGLLIVGVTALIGLFGGASRATKKLKKDLEDLRTGIDAAREGIRQEGEVDILLLEEVGATQSKVSKQRLNQLEKERSAEEGGLLALDAARTKLREKFQSKNISDVSAAIKGIKLVEEQTITAEKNISDLRQQIREENIKIRTQEKEEAKKDADDRIARAKELSDKQRELNQKALEDARKQRAADFEDYQAGIELKLLATEQGSKEELDLQKQLLRAKLQIDLEGEDITFNQRRLLIQKFFKERIELEKKFSKDLVAAWLADEKSRLSAQLENLNLGEQEKLDVKISFLQISAAQEIASAEGNAAKIKEINAKLNADISAAKIESIQKQADYEVAFLSAFGGVARRALETVASNEKMKGDIRINAIRQLGEIEQKELDRQIKANRDASVVQGADQKALGLVYQQLLDQKRAKAEKTEKDITAITLSEDEKRKAADLSYIQATISGLQQVADIVGTIQSNEQEATQNAIETRKREVAELLEAGAITEKEARIRNRRINEEERQAKQKAAQQQKNFAVFQALLAIPQAYIAGLTAPFPVGGPIYAAILAGLAGVSAAAIAAKRVPQFATGKKGRYSGVAEVGEIGAELIQRADGSMEVATKRQLVYLGASDKVFTAGETKKMLPYVNKDVMTTHGTADKFDYNKMAKAMGKSSNTTVNIDKEFISESVADGLSRVNYFDRYYNSKG